jgi:multidrug transporter EmrE-like cation transporter
MVGLYTSFLGDIPVVGLILLASGSVIAGDYSAKAWSVNGHGLYLLFAFLGYFFSAFFYTPTLLREGLIVTSVLWVLLSTIGFLLIGLVIFKETLSSLQIVAVVLGIIAIVLLTVLE